MNIAYVFVVACLFSNLFAAKPTDGAMSGQPPAASDSATGARLGTYESKAPKPAYTLIRVIKTNFEQKTLVKYFPDQNWLVVFDRKGRGEILNAKNDYKKSHTLTLPGQCWIRDIYVLNETHLLAYRSPSDVYEAAILDGSFSKIAHKEPMPAKDKSVVGSLDIQADSALEALNHFDLTDVGQFADDIMKEYLYPPGVKYLSPIYSYHVTADGMLYCGHDGDKVTVWKLK